jgi:hypothetical protein
MRQVTSDQGTQAKMLLTLPSFTAGTCTFPDAGVPTSPSITYDKTQVACGLPQNAGCEKRNDCIASPVPSAPFTRLCIHKDGDESCPSADYSVRFLAHKNVDDQRACSGCTGPSVTGGACGNKWGTSTPAACTNGALPPTTNTVATCVNNPGSGATINAGAIAPSGHQCTPTDASVPIGAAIPTEPVTFCCNN